MQLEALPPNPCDSLHCGPGTECVVSKEEEGPAQCRCVEECGEEVDERRNVCTNHNNTFSSDCHVYRGRCWCREEDPRCANTRN